MNLRTKRQNHRKSQGSNLGRHVAYKERNRQKAEEWMQGRKQKLMKEPINQREKENSTSSSLLWLEANEEDIFNYSEPIMLEGLHLNPTHPSASLGMHFNYLLMHSSLILWWTNAMIQILIWAMIHIDVLIVKPAHIQQPLASCYWLISLNSAHLK